MKPKTAAATKASMELARIKRIAKKNRHLIFDILFERKIPHAIIISKEQIKLRGNDFGSLIYSIYITQIDSVINSDLGFNIEAYNKRVRFIDLDEENIRAFKNEYYQFYTKIIHDANGRIFELKGNSFKEHYKRQFIQLDLNAKDYEKWLNRHDNRQKKGAK